MYFDIEKLFEICPYQMHWIGRATRMNFEPEMRLLPALCDKRKISLDVGAKAGMYAYRMMKHSLTVHAFEPVPILADLLRKVLKGKICIHEIALSDRPGFADIRIPASKFGVLKFGRSTIEPENSLTGFSPSDIQMIHIRTEMIDTLGLSDIGFIKVDVEGHEMSVIDGGMETIRESLPNLIIEANETHKRGSLEALRDTLCPLGYRCMVLLGGQLCCVEHVGQAALRDKENFVFSTNESLAD